MNVEAIHKVNCCMILKQLELEAEKFSHKFWPTYLLLETGNVKWDIRT